MNIFLFLLLHPYNISVFRLLGGLVPPVVMVLVTVLSSALVEARLAGLE